MAYFTSPFVFLDDFVMDEYESLRIDEQDVGAYELDLDRFKKAHPSESTVI
jgi:hypothetical protein